MFRAPLCSSSGESIVLIRYLVYVNYVGDRLVCTRHGHLHRVTYTRCHINRIYSPDDEDRGARNMYRIGINIYEKRIVRQVGYLQELMLTVSYSQLLQHCTSFPL